MKQQTQDKAPAAPSTNIGEDENQIIDGLQLAKSHTFSNRTNVLCRDGVKLFTIEHEDYTTLERRMQIDSMSAAAPDMYKALFDFMQVVRGITSVPKGSQLTITIDAKLFENASLALLKATPNK